MQGVPREIREIWDLQKNPEVTILESLNITGFLENPGGKQPSGLSLAPLGWKTQPLHTNTYKALETKTGEKIFTKNNCLNFLGLTLI